MLTRVHTRSFLREIEWFIRLIQPCEELSALFFHEGEVRGVNGDVRLLYFFFYAGTKRWRYHVIFLQIASFPRWGYFSLSLFLHTETDKSKGTDEAISFSLTAINTASMITSEKRKDLVARYLLILFFSTVRPLDLISLSDLSSSDFFSFSSLPPLFPRKLVRY